MPLPQPNYKNFQDLYDHSQIEKAVQDYFCSDAIALFAKPKDDDDPLRGKWTPPDGLIAFYTAFQNLTFQQCRPRVYLAGFKIGETRNWIIDANGLNRNKAWTGQMLIGVLTAANYKLHTQLRAAVLAIIPELNPLVVPVDGSAISTSGLNAFLKVHELAIFEPQQMETIIKPQDGEYHSFIPINLAYNVRAAAWPPGNIT